MFRKIITVIFLSGFSFYSFTQIYSIKGKINGWKDTICYFGNYYGDKQYVKDTARIDKSGNFIFEGEKKNPGGIYLVVMPNKRYFELIIDKEQIFSFETDTSDFIKNMKIKESEENILFYKYLNFISTRQKESESLRKQFNDFKKDTLSKSATRQDSIKLLQTKLNDIDKEVEKYKIDFIKDYPHLFLTTIFKAQKEPDVPKSPLLANGKEDSTFNYRYFKEHFFDNIDVTDDRLLRSPIFHTKLKYFFTNVIIQHPDSIIKEADILTEKAKSNKETFKYLVYYFTSTYESSNIMGMDAVFVHEVEKYYITKKAYWVDSVQLQKIIHRGLTLKPLLIGKPAPPLVMQDTNGKDVFLYSIKAKYTILLLWDPDCGHCQKVVPKMETFYEKIKLKGIKVYAVNTQHEDDKWKKFIREKNLNFINVHDKYKQYSLFQLYDIYSTPVIYLLDDKKIIKAKRIDVEQLEGFIDHLEKIK
ncbi:MAG: redoxin domain-containing protein [Bacteroidota bacterium]